MATDGTINLFLQDHLAQMDHWMVIMGKQVTETETQCTMLRRLPTA
jgi:hypothetical protein